MDTTPTTMQPPADDNAGRTSAEQIAFSVLRAIAEQRLGPGMRLGEENLASVFDVSRTVVRQALTQLAAHGIVGVRPKKGWYVIEPSDSEIRDIFAARKLLECALMREFVATATPTQIRILEKHLERQHEAIASHDVARRTHLLTDFHDQLAEIMGNAVIARMVRDLTMRTISCPCSTSPGRKLPTPPASTKKCCARSRSATLPPRRS